MTLPYADPSNPALPSPLFSDLTAVRADHMRANNAAIFSDLSFLDGNNPALVALTGGSFKTAALANANTYNGRSLFTCGVGVSDTPYSGVWRVFGTWNPTDSSGRFVAMLDSSLETWEINYAGAVWGTWTKHADSYGNRYANAFVDGYNTTAASGGVLTLGVASAQNQFLTGTLNHTVTLPVVSTLQLGRAFAITNAGTGTITVNSSGGNLVALILPSITRQFLCVLTSGTDAASWFVPAVRGTTPDYPYKFGLELSNNSGDANNDIDIATGRCSDTALAYFMTLASVITKRLDASWSAGTGNGGLFSGSKTLSTWYAVHLIRKDSDGSIDAGFDTSATAANKPAGYSNYRCIGWVRTDASNNIIAFFQVREKFYWKTPMLDVDTATLSTSAALTTLTVPPSGVMANMNVYIGNASNNAAVYLSPTYVNDLAPGITAAPLGSIRAGTFFNQANIKMLADANSQIRARSDQSGTTFKIATLGWEDVFFY
jgi:hypothetical protein